MGRAIIALKAETAGDMLETLKMFGVQALGTIEAKPGTCSFVIDCPSLHFPGIDIPQVTFTVEQKHEENKGSVEIMWKIVEQPKKPVFRLDA